MRTVSSPYVQAIFKSCVRHGAEAPLLLELIEGGARALENPAKRFGNHVPIDILNLAAKQTGDQAIGVKVGLGLRPSTFMDVGYALPFCENLADVLATNNKYQALTQQLGTTQLVRRGNTAWVEWSPLYGRVERHRYFVETVFAAYATIGRWLLWGEDNPVLSMHFRHSAPEDKTTHNMVFSDNIFFDSEYDCVEFIGDVVEVPMPNRNPEMMVFLRAKLDKQLAALDKPVGIATVVQHCIQQALPEGRPSIAGVAGILGQSERSLRRKLREENESFRALLERARKDSCEVYMREAKHSQAQIAQMLGYNDQSAYSRAFRAWFGVSPQKFKVPMFDTR